MRDTVRGWIREARHIAVLTGAGMSAESGVPTFRDAQTGLWSKFNPQDLATEAAFRAHPQRVWDWYAHRREMIDRVEPNAGHVALATYALRHPGRLTLITQNVDGLHQRAGSVDVLALHGNIAEDQWLDAPRACCQVDAIEAGHPPRCQVCGNLRRPAVVWFGEHLSAATLEVAELAARDCNLMLVVGTSGEVYPAAGLALIAHQCGARVVIVNPEPTPLDAVAEQCLPEPAAVCLPQLLL
ncbi:SIR2 family NAD-dependent protein deacylase [Hydrogenophaga sp. PBL-H3]|uniref:SIR2 family NAD-dependent protein deacylase n=1 Tax=Hydrogenophaga sp. PBL-H3 TaxID=434010 RepID=UPI00131FC626|nr:NAD-dependent deacylase [Hydrogenophaga sp. PBL-H3]QHE76384.1 NAD-dependent deacylase [Hydrogenophaga sp. PBL-H3]QHE80808.1 NAD-dependent deacylase [Hydrogenophaga sp. PBL-H3]